MAIEVDLKCEVVGGASSFIQLTDTPNDYTGEAGKVPVVNGTEDGLEFATVSANTGYTASGVLFEDDFDGTMLDPMWQQSGTFTTSVSGGFLNMRQTTGANFSSYLRRSDKTYFTNYFNFELEYFLRQTGASDFGMAASFKHDNAREYDFRYSHNDGFLKCFFSSTGAGNISSSQSRIPSIGDKIKISVTIRENRGSAKLFINDEHQFTLRINWDLDLSTTPLQPNRVTPTIAIFNCPEVDVNSCKFTDLSKLNSQISFVGDSYTQGYDAITTENVWTNKVCDFFNINCSKYAGGGNFTQNILDGIEQIIQNNPKNVILLIGVNDVNNSVPLETIQTNITSIVDQLETAGINVYVCTPVLFALNDPLNAWIRLTYPNQLIDTNGFLAGGGFSNTGTESLISSTTHPNEFANDMLAEGVIEYIAENGILNV